MALMVVDMGKFEVNLTVTSVGESPKSSTFSAEICHACVFGQE